MSTGGVTLVQSAVESRGIIMRYVPRKEFWPDPDLSRGSELSSIRLNRFSTSRCWVACATGPAFEVFLRIEPTLREILETHPELAKGPSTRYTCCLIGQREEKVRPAIVIHCHVKDYRRKCYRIIREDEHWNRFQCENPLFILLLADRAPTMLADGKDDEQDDEYIYLFSNETFSRLCGTSVRVANKQGVSSAAAGVATLGGIVLINGEPYGLTVAHVLYPSIREQQDIEQYGSSVTDIEAYSNSDQESVCDLEILGGDPLIMSIDDSSEYPEVDSGSEKSSEANSSLSSHDRNYSLTVGRSNQTALQKKEFEYDESKAKRIGKFAFASGGQNDIGIDWALFELHGEFPRWFNTDAKGTHFAGYESFSDIFPYLSQTEKPMLEHRDVVVFTASRGPVRGKMLGTKSYFRASGQEHFFEVSTLYLDESLSLGDCGSWVFDATDGEWVGHVIAEEPGQTIVYVVPALAIKKDIERLTQSVLTFPSADLLELSPCALHPWRGLGTKTLYDIAQALQLSHNDTELEKGQMLEKLGNIVEAKALGTFRKKVLLGLVYRDQGRLEEAEKLICEAIEEELESPITNQAAVLTSKNALGLVFLCQGRSSQAEMLLRETLRKQRELLGQTHPDTLACLWSLASACSDEGRLLEATEILEQTWSNQIKLQGEDHLDTLASLRSLGLVLVDQGKFQNAKMMLEKALAGQKRVLGEENIETLLTKSDLAVLHGRVDELDEAVRALRQILEPKKRLSIGSHTIAVLINSNIAFILACLGRVTAAEKLLRRVLQEQDSSPAQSQPNMILLRRNLAVVLQDEGRFDEAESLLQQNIQVQENLLGKEHRRTVETKRLLDAFRKEKHESSNRTDLERKFSELKTKEIGMSQESTMKYVNGLLRDKF